MSSATGRRDALIGIALAAAVIAPFAVVLSGGSGHHVGDAHGRTPQQLAARAAVISALNATTGSGSFKVAYRFTGLTPAPGTTTTTNPPCGPPPGVPGSASVPPPAGPCGGPSPDVAGLPIDGTAIIDTQPYAIVAVSNVPSLGQVTVRANDTDLWEFGGADYGLAPGSGNAGEGSPLSQFAGLVAGTLGQREGALAMLSLASSTGYLNLEQQEVAAADPVGSSTVDGVPVQEYRVFITPQQQAELPNLSDEQSKTITAALTTLNNNGFLGTSVVVSIDPSGYVRRTVASAQFSDGVTAVSESTLSDFGCAGTVLMPGQSGSGAPPAGCVSPDTGAPTTTTTTSTVPSGSGSSVPATSSTSIPGSPSGGSTTSTVSSSTTTTTTGVNSTTTTTGSTTTT
jgi:hypothetical protein